MESKYTKYAFVYTVCNRTVILYVNKCEKETIGLTMVKAGQTVSPFRHSKITRSLDEAKATYKPVAVLLEWANIALIKYIFLVHYILWGEIQGR